MLGHCVERHYRPRSAVRLTFVTLRCGASIWTFAATAKSSEFLIHTMRNFQTLATSAPMAAFRVLIETRKRGTGTDRHPLGCISQAGLLGSKDVFRTETYAARFFRRIRPAKPTKPDKSSKPPAGSGTGLGNVPVSVSNAEYFTASCEKL
jgi:hypothetical protein